MRIKNSSIREFLGEFLGTCTLTCLGCAGNAMVNLNGTGSNNLIVVPITWGLALTVAIYVCGGVSGGHVNPAVTVALASVNKFRWNKIFHYVAAQYLGAFVGSLLTYAVYQESIHAKGLNSSTIGIFGTFSRPDVSTATCLVDQIICTAFFLLIICAITDEKNMNVPKGLVPLAIGFANIGLMHISFGYNCGTPLNPARDFGPRFATLILGWGAAALNYKDYSYFWIPIVACHLGGIIGCWAYKLLIEAHWPDDEEDFSIEFNADSTEGQVYTKGVRITSN